MDSVSNHKQLLLAPVSDRRLHNHVNNAVTIQLLPRLILCSLICLSGTLAGQVPAVEPQIASDVAFQGDGRLLGYTRLREGTRIPATLGTVVALGPRRWAFVPAAAPVIEPVQSVTQSETVEIKVTQQGGTVTRRVDSVTLSNKIPAAVGGAASRANAAASALQDTGDAEPDGNNSEHIVLITENLMLQRIVQAIKEDELDNLWQVTGRVTEYFGENRLTILTAQRGQAKQLPPAVGR